MNAKVQPLSEPVAQAAQLLKQVGVTGSFNLIPLPGGANSKAFRIDGDVGAPALFLKAYFHHQDDPRDRIGTEFAFSSFAWQHGIRTIAEPLAMNRVRRCALYSFLDGRKIESHELSHDLIEQCLQFFAAINTYKEFASNLPVASEACFTLAEHFQCLERRVKRLKTITAADPVDQQAQEFICAKLGPACTKHLRVAENLASLMNITCKAPVRDIDRCLSSSDFGFHNALKGPDGALKFLDFEYAGWDDPAKTVCDFFCQPACPVPIRYYAEFANRIAEGTLDPKKSRRRFDLLLPIYRLKWCCIMLNDFLPVGSSRRRYAIHGMDEATRKRLQLQKASSALEHCLDESRLELAA